MGHAYEALLADVVARYHRSCGRDVFFLTGTDEHGQKIADAAASQGLRPLELSTKYADIFRGLNERIGISNDGFVRTTSDEHRVVAQKLWNRARDAGDLYLDTYSGWYSVREEAFVTEHEAASNDYKDVATGKPLIKMEEESWFFRLGKYVPRLIEHIERNEHFIEPAERRREILTHLRSPPPDSDGNLSVSRCTFDWGVPVPSDGDDDDDDDDDDAKRKRHVMYVWFDALSNYLTGVGYGRGDGDEQFQRYWPANVHVIGKDITRFHCVIWPCMLMSCDLPLPERVFAHGFVLAPDGRKMGKSLGNAIDPFAAIDTYGADSFRWFLVRASPPGNDVPFSEQSLVERHNADLIKSFGNLVHRALNLCRKFCGGECAPARHIGGECVPPFDLDALRTQIGAAMDELNTARATELIVTATHGVNQWITVLEPWKLRDEPERRAAIVTTLVEAVYALLHFYRPYIPEGVDSVLAKFDVDGREHRPLALGELSANFDNLPPGTKIHVGDVMYKPLEIKVEPIQSVSLLVGRIDSVKRHPNAERLFVAKVCVGSAVRQVVAGLVGHYTEEQLQDKLVVVVANLKPSKLRGQTSQGMLLCSIEPADKAAGTELKVQLLEPPPGSTAGAAIRAGQLPPTPAKQLSIKDFGKLEFTVRDGTIFSSQQQLQVGGQPIRVLSSDQCSVG
jgi:methionyl-tRNA synthetase